MVIIVLVKIWQILSDNIHALEENIFKNFWQPINYENRDQTIDVIVKLYYKYIQSKMAKTKNFY